MPEPRVSREVLNRRIEQLQDWLENGTTLAPAFHKNVLDTDLDLRDARDEIERLKAGDFTPEEFQNMCHKVCENDGPEKFAQGCVEYQRQLFGHSPTEKRITELESKIERLKKYVKWDGQIITEKTGIIHEMDHKLHELEAENARLREDHKDKVKDLVKYYEGYYDGMF